MRKGRDTIPMGTSDLLTFSRVNDRERVRTVYESQLIPIFFLVGTNVLRKLVKTKETHWESRCIANFKMELKALHLSLCPQLHGKRKEKNLVSLRRKLMTLISKGEIIGSSYPSLERTKHRLRER